MRLGLIFFWLLACIAQPAAAQSPLAAQLQNQLAMLVTSKSADVGVAAIDLTTGEMVSVRGDQRYPMASTMKIAVAKMDMSASVIALAIPSVSQNSDHQTQVA